MPWASAHHRASRDSTPSVPKQSGGAVVLPVLLLLGAAGAGFYFMRHRGPHDMPVTVSKDSGEDVEWDAANDPPIIASLGGREDFVGAFWKAQKGESRRDHSVYVGLFDGTSHERVWYAGPFGRIAQAKGSTHFGFSQGHILATDYRGMLYSFDADLFTDGKGPTNENRSLSAKDKTMIRSMYPKDGGKR